MDEKRKIKANQLNEIPYQTEIIAEDLFIPWAIDISEEGVLYFTQRSGVLSKIVAGRPLPLMTFRAPFISQGEGGLLGIALDPDFSQNHYIYVMHSYMENNHLYNRIVRLVEQNNRALVDLVLLDKIPGGQFHNGGRIKIGPDKKLYITTGDSGNAMLAQDINSLGGKILRIDLDGKIPEDNPFPNSPVYSLGHRDPQGITWDTNLFMYESEHGATAHDEINIILPGVNYGWPIVQGDEISDTGKFQMPLVQSGDATWAPSGIAYITQGPWQGKLMVAALRGEELLVITLNQDKTAVTKVEAYLQKQFGRLREVVQAKDGSIYLTTSNMDGRGVPEAGDDKIIRLVPRKN